MPGFHSSSSLPALIRQFTLLPKTWQKGLKTRLKFSSPGSKELITVRELWGWGDPYTNHILSISRQKQAAALTRTNSPKEANGTFAQVRNAKAYTASSLLNNLQNWITIKQTEREQEAEEQIKRTNQHISLTCKYLVQAHSFTQDAYERFDGCS